MKLNCPECGTSIPAENINIQKMAAVCPSCGAVFQFEPAQAKAKRRKVHQPQNLELHDTDERLQMAFRTNWRLAQNGDFLSSALLGFSFTFLTVAMTSVRMSGEALSGGPLMWLIPGIFALLSLIFYYRTATVAYNKTHIEMDDERISVSRKPIPSLFEQDNDVRLAGVTVIRYEETPASKKEGYDLPRYNVWAETADGSRKIIVKDVIEEYAVFISQRLNERLAMDADVSLDADADVSRLIENDTASDIEADATFDDTIQSSNGRYRG
jgi:hypothetical protein